MKKHCAIFQNEDIGELDEEINTWLRYFDVSGIDIVNITQSQSGNLVTITIFYRSE